MLTKNFDVQLRSKLTGYCLEPELEPFNMEFNAQNQNQKTLE